MHPHPALVICQSVCLALSAPGRPPAWTVPRRAWGSAGGRPRRCPRRPGTSAPSSCWTRWSSGSGSSWTPSPPARRCCGSWAAAGARSQLLAGSVSARAGPGRDPEREWVGTALDRCQLPPWRVEARPPTALPPRKPFHQKVLCYLPNFCLGSRGLILPGLSSQPPFFFLSLSVLTRTSQPKRERCHNQLSLPGVAFQRTRAMELQSPDQRPDFSPSFDPGGWAEKHALSKGASLHR